MLNGRCANLRLTVREYWNSCAEAGHLLDLQLQPVVRPLVDLYLRKIVSRSVFTEQ